MVKRLVHFALDQKAATLIAIGVLVVFGIYSFREIPVEAFPDPDDVHVQVITLWPGQASEEMESLVTRPIEMGLNGTPHLSNLRSVSMFGLSVVTLTFEDGTEDNLARTLVMQGMQGVNLPQAAQWQLGALTNSTGEIFRYVVRAPGWKLEEVRAIEDWVVEPALREVPGVGDVNGFGGGTKQYQVCVDPARLAQHAVTFQQVFTAVQNNNVNVAGDVLRSGDQMFVIRGVSLLKDVADIGAISVASQNGRPVFVRDVAEVRTGMAPRQGIVGFYRAADTSGPAEDIDDVVEGIVLHRKGTNALDVVQGVKKKVEFLNRFRLPKGVQLVQTYDRTELVDQTLHTVFHNLAEGALLVIVILLVFTSSLRSALIVATVIPLSLLCTFIALYLRDIPANLLSFGAVDFGIIVDASVVIVEGMLVRKALVTATNGGRLPSDFNFTEMVRDVATHLGRPLLFGNLIIITALLPIFTFQRVEGRIFRPMAYTIGSAILGATFFTFTLMPLLAAVFLRGGGDPGPNFLVRHIKSGYEKLLRAALDFKVIPILTAVVLLAFALFLGAQLGTEFLPKLDEGNIWMKIVQPLSVSKERSKDTERHVRAILKTFPEVAMIYSQLGRPEDGTDTKGINNIEWGVILKRKSEWTTRGPDGRVVDKEGLIALMDEKIHEIPGLILNFSQVIEDNVSEALSGVQGELVIKLFGDDLTALQSTAEDIRHALTDTPGVADLAVEQLFGQPNLNIRVKREAIARYGLDTQTVLNLVQTGLGGQAYGSLLEGQRRFDIAVRLDESVRDIPAKIASLWVDTPGGQRVPLSQLAEVRLEDGANRISRDRNSRRAAIKCNIRGRDMGSFVADAQQRVASRVKLPPGYTVTWEGQFENQQRANARLMVIIPLSLLAVVFLLFWALQRLRYCALIMIDVPFALVGGVTALWLTHTNLGVSAIIGFVAISGVSVLNGLIMVGQFNTLRAKGSTLREAVVHGACVRIRPVLMTALMASIGMLPMAISHDIGSEVQRPLALVVVGGMLSAVILTLFILPTLYEWIERAFPAPVTVPEGLIE